MKYLYSVVFLLALALPINAASEPVVLDVPFTAQAPFENWSWPWQDFCEEAAVVMAHSYTSGKKLSNIEYGLEMLKLAVFELQTFGFEKDTDTVHTQRMFNEYYAHTNTRLVTNPSLENIKQELKNGNVVIAPAAGKLLANPHYRTPGPRYHMVVIRGFDHKDFIVNDPGTKFGNSYRYPQQILLNAIYDFVPPGKDITTGRKAVIVVEKTKLQHFTQK